MKADFKTTGKEQCNLIHIILYITATTQTVEHKIKVTMIIGMQLSFDWFKADAESPPPPQFNDCEWKRVGFAQRASIITETAMCLSLENW